MSIKQITGKPNFAADFWKQVLNPVGLRRFARAYTHQSAAKPLLIAESGTCHRHADGVGHPRPDGATRELFFPAYLFEVTKILREGIPLIGYLHWSFCDNYEWGSYRQRFGMFMTDYARNAERRPVDAFGANGAGAYAKLVRALRSGELPASKAAFLEKGYPRIEV